MAISHTHCGDVRWQTAFWFEERGRVLSYVSFTVYTVRLQYAFVFTFCLYASPVLHMRMRSQSQTVPYTPLNVDRLLAP